MPDTDHVVRYVRPMSVLDDGSVDGSVFCLRPEDTGVSVNWLECFQEKTRDEQLDEVRSRSRLTLRSSGRLAELNIGMLKRHVVGRLSTLRVVHMPLNAEGGYTDDPSHSEMVGLPEADSSEGALIGDMIAECVRGVHPALM